MRKWKDGMELDINFRRPENQMNEMLTNKVHVELQELAPDNQNNLCTNSAESQLELLVLVNL